MIKHDEALGLVVAISLRYIDRKMLVRAQEVMALRGLENHPIWVSKEFWRQWRSYCESN